MCGEQQRIVDQAKAQGNAWDTGVVPGQEFMLKVLLGTSKPAADADKT